MKAPNHIVGGFVFTGLFGSIMGVNILSHSLFLFVTVFASILPDVDHPKSICGRLVLPLSRWLNRRYGHRTITHSLPALIASTAVVAMVDEYIFGFDIALVYGLAFSSHLVFDMMTVQGVPLFYPFVRNACVIPGDPSKRMRTNNLRHEAVAMCLFLVAAFSLQPLITNGFWNTYNSTFGSMQHLYSEFRKSNNLIRVSFDVKEGAQLFHHSGYVISAKKNSFVYLDGGVLRDMPENDRQIVSDIVPVRTDSMIVYSVDDLVVENIEEFDFDRCFIRLEMNSNYSFGYKGEEVNSVDLENVCGPGFGVIRMPVRDKFIFNSMVESYEREIQRLFLDYEREMNVYTLALDTRHKLEEAIKMTSNYVARDSLHQVLKSLERPTIPKDPHAKVDALLAKIENEKKKEAHERALHENANLFEPCYINISFSAFSITGPGPTY